MKSISKIIEKLNSLEIEVYECIEENKLCGYELSTYTNAGVNQILFIDFRGTQYNPKNPNHFIHLFNERVSSIDINEELRYLLNDNSYLNNIGAELGVQDLIEWKKNLENIFTDEKNKKTAKQKLYEQVINKLQSLLKQMHDELEFMPTKGNSINDCQKTNIIYHLNQLDSCINGIELEDFTPNEYSGNFKLSYS